MNNYPPKIELNNKVVLISGGYGHLGSAMVKGLLDHGAKVVVLARDEQKYQELLNELNEDHKNNLFYQSCDIADTLSIKNAFESAFLKLGKIDVLVNNAAYHKGQSPENMTDEDWASGLDGVLSSVFRAIREIIPYFRKAGGGSIINVSSMYGMVAPDFGIYKESPKFLNPPHYGAAKAGVIQLTKYYASYLGEEGIRVNTVTPGPFPTESVQMDKTFMASLRKKTLMNRFGTPQDVAGIFVFLSSDASNFITGQNFIVDGGWTTV